MRSSAARARKVRPLSPATSSIPATIYEAETSAGARTQGGQLDIDPQGGVLLDEPDDATGGRPEVLCFGENAPRSLIDLLTGVA